MKPMSSWRDSASKVEQDDLDGLLDTVVPAAQQLLEKYGEFFPFGAAVTGDGETRLLADHPDRTEHPTSADVLTALVDGVRGQRDDLRAVAICSDARLADSDAIRVDLEHREGAAMAVLLPYKHKLFGQGYEYAELQASSAGRRFWSKGGT
jgi:hypothetical protein